MKKIVFFNQFHNGDCFLGKNYVRAIQQHLPDIEYAYAHGNHPDILKDLNLQHLTLDDIPAMDRMTRVAVSKDGDTVYINTWVGCWQGTLFPYGEHINYLRLHAIWAEYFKYLKIEQHWKTNPNEYLPEIDYDKFHGINLAEAWVNEHNRPRILLCNGVAKSGQSRVSDLHQCVDALSNTYKDIDFILTQKLDLERSNIYYTDDIFNGLESDINQIAYLAQYCNVIVGKNSGPFSYCQNKQNLLNENLTFFNLSVLPTDCPSGGGLYRARCVFSSETNDIRIAAMISMLINHADYRGTEILS